MNSLIFNRLKNIYWVSRIWKNNFSFSTISEFFWIFESFEESVFRPFDFLSFDHSRKFVSFDRSSKVLEFSVSQMIELYFDHLKEFHAFRPFERISRISTIREVSLVSTIREVFWVSIDWKIFLNYEPFKKFIMFWLFEIIFSVSTI